jgi:hypothetical protein
LIRDSFNFTDKHKEIDMPEREFRILRVEYRPDDQDIVKERIALALNGHEFYTKKA